MTQQTEPQYWQYQVRAGMAGQKPLSELLLSEKRTHKEAVEYCVNRWGDRFKGTLKPYDPIKISKAEDARTDVLTTAERMQRHREGLERKRRLAEKKEQAARQVEKKLWNVFLFTGESKALTSVKRTREQAEKRAYQLYGSRVRNIDEWHELPK